VKVGPKPGSTQVQGQSKLLHHMLPFLTAVGTDVSNAGGLIPNAILNTVSESYDILLSSDVLRIILKIFNCYIF
jgi:hypothetical protein